MSIDNEYKKIIRGKIQEGDIILERDSGLVPNVIADCMKIEGKKLGVYNEFCDNIGQSGQLDRIYNHSNYAIRKDYTNFDVRLLSAFADGVDYKNIDILFNKKVKYICILRFNKQINQYLRSANLLKIQSYGRQYEGRKYDYPSLFLWHPLHVVFNSWKGKKGDNAERFLFCYEITLIMANHWSFELVGEEYFKDTYKSNFWYFYYMVKAGILEIVWQGKINS